MPNIDGKTNHIAHIAVQRPWGTYIVINEGIGYKIKIIQVSPGAKLSLQMHCHRSEHWVVLTGKAVVTKENQEYHLSAGESINIPVKTKHMLHNPEITELKIIEVQHGDYLGEDDIIRYQDIYGRVT